MKVREIMTTDIQRVTPDKVLSDIAALMRDEDIGAVPIVEDGELRGIVTDRDIVIRAVADGKNPSTTAAEDVLSEEVGSVGPDTDIKEAADLMALRQIRRLPVVEDGQLIGMVSLGDIAVKHEEGTAAYALEAVSDHIKASAHLAQPGETTELEPKGSAESAAAPRRKKTTKARQKSSRKAA